MRCPRGSSIDPQSGCNAPRIKSSRLDLPAPLRPTSPTLLPSAICALAPSSKARPPMRYVTAESISIGVLYHGQTAPGDESRGRRADRHFRLELRRLGGGLLYAGVLNIGGESTMHT